MNLWLEFLGYWISEGHLSVPSSKRERYNVFVSQTNKKNREKIKKCLKKLPFNFFETKDRFIVSNQGLWIYLKQFGNSTTKFIPKEFKELNISHLKILFDALILGDGTIIKQKDSFVFRYSTISEKLKNDIIEIALKLGYRVHLDKRKRKGRFEYSILCGNYKPTTLANLRRKNISSYNYKGKVYCPELKKNHILIIERDGRISANMNSFDIGLQALSGMLERGHKVLFICYDNEAYMNTGVQRSSATPLHAGTTTSPYGSVVRGKLEQKKNMPFIVASHSTSKNKIYVATASIGYLEDFKNKIKKALASIQKNNAPAYIQVLCPCIPGWKMPSNLAIRLSKMATDVKMYPLFEIENGQINLKEFSSKEKVQDYLKLQGRFSHLQEKDIQEIQKSVDEQYEKLKKLASYKVKLF